MHVNYVLILLVLLAVVIISNQEDPDAQYRKDLKQINYYNWLLHRHRTEKQKIEKVNKWVFGRNVQVLNTKSDDNNVSSDIKAARLIKLQQIMDTPAPHNVTLIATDSDFSKIRRFVHPVGNKPVTESFAELSAILKPQRRQARQGQNDAPGKEETEGLVEFQLSEREYQKFSKFLTNKTLKKKVV